MLVFTSALYKTVGKNISTDGGRGGGKKIIWLKHLLYNAAKSKKFCSESRTCEHYKI